MCPPSFLVIILFSLMGFPGLFVGRFDREILLQLYVPSTLNLPIGVRILSLLNKGKDSLMMIE